MQELVGIVIFESIVNTMRKSLNGDLTTNPDSDCAISDDDVLLAVESDDSVNELVKTTG